MGELAAERRRLAPPLPGLLTRFVHGLVGPAHRLALGLLAVGTGLDDPGLLLQLDALLLEHPAVGRQVDRPAIDQRILDRVSELPVELGDAWSFSHALPVRPLVDAEPLVHN